jgi:hypothetical protein
VVRPQHGRTQLALGDLEQPPMPIEDLPRRPQQPAQRLVRRALLLPALLEHGPAWLIVRSRTASSTASRDGKCA